MMTYKIFLAALLGTAIHIAPASASHHFETPLAREHPQYDLTDLYVFPTAKGDSTVFIMDFNPQAGTAGLANFGDNGLYNLHIASDTGLSSGLTLTVRFADGRVMLGRVDEPNGKLGAMGQSLGSVPVGSDGRLDNGIRVWTGVVRDPFVGNSAGLVAFRAALTKGKLDMTGFAPGVDLFAPRMISSIVLEVPNRLLPENIHIFATTAMRKKDEWIQVNRMANPLMTHLFMFNNDPEQFEHVHHRPDTDHERAYVVSDVVLRAAALAGKENPVAFADGVAKQILPDLIPYKVGTPAHYVFGDINGRKPTDDAMDTALSVFLGKPVTDHANTFDRHPAEFPYLVPAPVTP